jgi:MtN3 and saliva related transmembrane protein
MIGCALQLGRPAIDTPPAAAGAAAAHPIVRANGMTAMNLIDTLGFVAATLTTGSFVPQAWLTFRTRDVSGISLAMYSAFTLGIVAWLIYGLMLGAWPVIVANGITLALAVAILSMKIWIGRRG